MGFERTLGQDYFRFSYKTDKSYELFVPFCIREFSLPLLGDGPLFLEELVLWLNKSISLIICSLKSI